MTSVDPELAALRTQAAAATAPALADGSWLLPVVRDVLTSYAHTDAESLHAAHEGLSGEDLVDARIADAQRRSLIAGGLSATAYASVVAGGLATGGLLAFAALPTAIASFAFDVYSAARIQLRLGWDLAALHGHPVDPTDDGHLLDLARISYGVDPKGPRRSIARGFLPVATRLGNRTATLASRAATDLAMRSLGRELVQRGIGRFAVPALGIPLCAGVNWFTTGRIAANARRILRGHRQARGDARSLADDLHAAPTLLLEALLWIGHADGRLAGVEVRLVDDLQALLDDRGALPNVAVDDGEAWLADLARADGEVRVAVYEAAVRAAALDGVLHSEEDQRLRRLAEACGVPFEAAAVSRAIQAVRGH